MEIEGLESTTAVIPYGDGDARTHRKRPGRTSFTPVILRRELSDALELWAWHEKVIEGNIEHAGCHGEG